MEKKCVFCEVETEFLGVQGRMVIVKINMSYNKADFTVRESTLVVLFISGKINLRLFGCQRNVHQIFKCSESTVTHLWWISAITLTI
jgi:hypothetical protein